MHQKNEPSVQEYCANMLKSLHTRGISAIPLNGKRPHFSIKWKQFQTAVPSSHQIDDWVRRGFASYGIICGRVSQGIIVIDFDSCELYEGFCSSFHYIQDTYTVRTRRGFHVYLKTKFHVAPRSFEHCDIKGDGGYVVGAGSVIEGHRYCVARNTSIRTITYAQYQHIVDWLSPKFEQLTLPISTPDSNFDLTSYYVERVPKVGRNNALYATAIEARKQGISKQHVIDKLVPCHILAQPSHTHRDESPRQRTREATRTIQSAYTHKSQISKHAGLPNNIRESLLQIQGSTIAPRLLDTLRLLMPDKKWITSSQLIQVAKSCHLSKKSLYRILNGDLARINGKRVFKQYRYTDHKDNIDINDSQDDTGKPNSKRGCPIQFVYKIPTDYYLSNIFRIDTGLGDKLKLADLSSADAYRRALHRELIRRLSPMIRVEWLAQRLGVHRRTIFRYNIQLNIKITPMIQKQPLTQELAKGLGAGRDDGIRSFTPGMWIEAKSGNRYPAIKEIANSLVSDGKSKAVLCRQLPSKYELDDDEGDAYSVELPDHLKRRATLLTYETVRDILPPDWATKKYDLGGYLAVYNGYEWTFKPPLRVIAYPLVKAYEDGLIYYIRPLKS